MADTFVLHTICPVGHAIPFRRNVSTWRLSLDAPAVVLWCYECGLEWHAQEHDRTAVAEAVRRATAIEGERRADHGSDRDLKTRADASAGPHRATRTRLGGIADTASGYEVRPIPFATSLRQRANGHRCHIRDCGSEGRSMLLATNRDLRRFCRGRQATHGRFSRVGFTSPTARATVSATTLIPAAETNLSRVRSERPTSGHARGVVTGRLGWDRLWWAPTAAGVAIVGLLTLAWIVQREFPPDAGNEAVELRTDGEPVPGANDAIVSQSAPGERRETTVEERIGTGNVTAPAALGQPTVRTLPAAPAVPIRTSAESRRGSASPATGRKRKGAASKSAVALVAQIPAGTLVPLHLETPVRSTTLPGTLVRARVRNDVVVRKRVVIPRGSILDGHVTSAERPRSRWISALKVWEFGKRRSVVLSFTTLRRPGSTSQSARIRTAPVAARGRSASRPAAIPAALVAVGGAIVAGPLGAAGGGIVGRAVARSIDDRAQLPRGTPISAQILDPVQAQ